MLCFENNKYLVLIIIISEILLFSYKWEGGYLAKKILNF